MVNISRSHTIGKTVSVSLLTLFLSSLLHAELLLGVHPFKTGSALTQQFAPLSQYLSKQLNEKVRILITKDYATHIRYTGLDQVDLAFMGPSSYVEMTEKYGSKPLLARLETDGQPYLFGIYIARASSAALDGAVNSLEDLAGHTMAFGSPTPP